MDELFGSLFMTLLCLGIPVLIVGAFVYLQKETKKEEEAFKLELQQSLQSMPKESQTAFMVHYASKEKKPMTAILLALLLGNIGAHKFYLGQTALGILYLLFAWTTIPWIIAFFEAFTMTKNVHRHNRSVARESAALVGGDAKAFVANL